ncbi:MAG TPA: IS110 family transposase [Caldilineaceae bacterium]|nr:IS110 family transposase [Caldilineaceae bacterium]
MFLGIDLSKRYFDATLQAEGQSCYRRFSNDAVGIQALLRWLEQQQVTGLHACMEATNLYWEEVAQALYEQEYTVSVVNPARIKGFAMSQMRRNKSDKQDSVVIAAFCAAVRPQAWQPPSAVQRKLRTLERYADDLKQTLTQQKNRLLSSKDPDVQRSLQRLIGQIEQELQQLEAQIAQQIAEQESLQTQQALLTSIIGIGEQVAHKLLAEFYDLPTYASARSAAADAGLTPAHHESGDSVRRKPRLSKVGKAAVRSILFLPAISAMRFNPVVKALADRLKARGKPKKVIMAAAMRKLMHLAYGVLKNQRPFDPNYGPVTPVPT